MTMLWPWGHEPTHEILEAQNPLLEKEQVVPIKPRPITSLAGISRWVFVVLIISLAFSGGFVLGKPREKPSRSADSLKQAPTEAIELSFVFNSSFAVPPPAVDKDDVWNSMVPNGLGYIKDPTLAPKASVLSIFHQLHCLYTLRRAYYSDAPEGQLENFDLGKDRPYHVSHCFDYIRQSLLCSADSSIEPGIDEKNGFLGSGYVRQCRDFEQLKQWAERHRAFDAQGFLAKGRPGQHNF